MGELKACETEQDAMNSVSEALLDAGLSEGWMAAVWRIDSRDDPIRQWVNLVTWKYPLDAFLQAVRLLVAELDRRRNIPAIPPPLPSADFESLVKKAMRGESHVAKSVDGETSVVHDPKGGPDGTPG